MVDSLFMFQTKFPNSQKKFQNFLKNSAEANEDFFMWKYVPLTEKTKKVLCKSQESSKAGAAFLMKLSQKGE